MSGEAGAAEPGGGAGEAGRGSGSSAGGAGPRLALLVVALLFSTGGAAIKATDLGAWQVAGLRSALAAVFLFFALPPARRRPTLPALAVGAAYAVTMLLFVAGNKLTTAANTIFLQSTAPLWVLLLAPRLLGEPVRRRDLGFMAALAGGMAMFFLGVDQPSVTAPDPRTGNLLAAGAGVTWALTLLGLRGLGRPEPAPAAASRGAPARPRPAGGVGGAQAVLLGNALAVLVCLPGMLAPAAPGAGIADASVGDWALIAYLGVFQIGLAYVLLTRAMSAVPALEASLLLLTEPVFNPLWAWLTLGERPGAWSLAGGGLILGATAVRTLFEARRKRRAPGPPGEGG